jgi:hypothetical protein
MKRDWIIAVCSSGSEGVYLSKFHGDDDEVKQKLYELLCEDKEYDKSYDYGCESVDDIENLYSCSEYYAYAVYNDHHIDYTARELADIDFIK